MLGVGRKLVFSAVPCALLLVAVPPARAGEASPPLLERSAEVALALSACPPRLARDAAVYALERGGYVKVREGRNGFVALVDHRIPNAVEPQCMDAEGAKTFLPVMLRRAELRAQGKSPAEIRRVLAEGWAKGTFRPPLHAGVNYMLSTKNVVTIDEDKGIAAPYPPHLMFYAPYLVNADIGSDGDPAGPVFVVDEGSAHALMIVPVGGHGGAHHAPPDKASQTPK